MLKDKQGTLLKSTCLKKLIVLVKFNNWKFGIGWSNLTPNKVEQEDKGGLRSRRAAFDTQRWRAGEDGYQKWSIMGYETRFAYLCWGMLDP